MGRLGGHMVCWLGCLHRDCRTDTDVQARHRVGLIEYIAVASDLDCKVWQWHSSDHLPCVPEAHLGVGSATIR